MNTALLERREAREKRQIHVATLAASIAERFSAPNGLNLRKAVTDLFNVQRGEIRRTFPLQHDHQGAFTRIVWLLLSMDLGLRKINATAVILQHIMVDITPAEIELADEISRTLRPWVSSWR